METVSKRKRGVGVWALMEDTIKSIMADPKATPSEKLKAIGEMRELLALRHKLKEDGGTGGFFPTT